MEPAHHHFPWIDQVIVYAGHHAGPEATGPVGCSELASQLRQIRAAAGGPKEAILEVMRQRGSVLQIAGRLALGVQKVLDLLGDSLAVRQEMLQQVQMGAKRS